MNKLKEIELKVFIGENISSILDVIDSFNWTRNEEEYQEDIYYTSEHKDFIKTEECLRIRESKGRCELTWKPPTTGEMLEKKQFWKQEINIFFERQKEEAKGLLQNLGFIEYVTVRKKRIRYDVDDKTNVALDYISSLGWFIEIETNLEEEQEGLNINEQIANSLSINLNQRINVPYRDLVKEGKVYYQ